MCRLVVKIHPSTNSDPVPSSSKKSSPTLLGALTLPVLPHAIRYVCYYGLDMPHFLLSCTSVSLYNGQVLKAMGFTLIIIPSRKAEQRYLFF